MNQTWYLTWHVTFWKLYINTCTTCTRTCTVVYITSSSKKVTFLFHSALSRRHHTVSAIHSVCMCVQSVNGCDLPTCKTMKSQLIHLPARIDSFILPLSSKVFWGSACMPFFDPFVMHGTIHTYSTYMCTWQACHDEQCIPFCMSAHASIAHYHSLYMLHLWPRIRQ
jgi:hypothetical protein